MSFSLNKLILFFNDLIKKIFRIISYYRIRLARIKASPYAISSGFACGSMVSFTPLLGFHFVLAVVFAYILRANLVAALIGTIIGNPLTFPFIWGAIYKIGAYVSSETYSQLNYEISLEMMLSRTYDILVPMLIGSSILAIPIWFITYIYCSILP